ncbi:MAG TPA: cytoplasmic protein [Candidatus Bathyarchaeia archaeon]|nr:cytoplasmic protein [Candidatus Bathyarchaeia archaeon]
METAIKKIRKKGFGVMKGVTPFTTKDELTAHAIDPAKTDHDKYKVIFENNRVRVYDYKDEPGDKTKLHHHKDFLLYALSPFKRKMTFTNGKTTTRELKQGETLWSDEQAHIGENIGDTNTHVLIIELKEPPPKHKK